MTGIKVGSDPHKISLYVDDILLFLSSPKEFIASFFKDDSTLWKFSGNKIAYSEAMPLTPNMSWPPSSSFHWSSSGFDCLGIHITPTHSVFILFLPIPISMKLALFSKIKEELACWTDLPLSVLGWVNLFKMNILPRLLYPFLMILALLKQRNCSKNHLGLF